MKDNVKRLLAFVLAAVMLVSLCPTLGVSAATAEPEAEAAQGETSNSYEPWKHGYRLVDVLNWSPETDNYGEELRARVPLQERNEPFTATQANPNLKSEAQVYNVAMGNYRSTDTAEAPGTAASTTMISRTTCSSSGSIPITSAPAAGPPRASTL